jgi:hypothetical protein
VGVGERNNHPALAAKNEIGVRGSERSSKELTATKINNCQNGSDLSTY